MATALMHAMVLDKQGSPLRMTERAIPEPGEGELLLQVHACGVCRTDLHIVDGDLTKPKLPLVLGHEIVGTVLKLGAGVSGFTKGQRVGVPWLGETCKHCRFCTSGRENLCDNPKFTGYDTDGGYATHAICKSDFCFALPDGMSDAESAPLLCAGLIGWRTLKLAGEGKRLGIYGFGAAAHIIIQVARHQGRDVYAFTRAGDESGQEYARKLGATWAGSSEELPPKALDAALIFAPVGGLIPLALKASDKGAAIVSGGIYMSDIPAFPYSLLWEERSIKSVANLTRQDAREFFDFIRQVKIHTDVTEYELAHANQALDDLRHGRFHGAAVLSNRVPTQ
jgi:propanol-preferring alcohol dehydrogenase